MCKLNPNCDCKHFSRKRYGPTSRHKDFMILVDSCYECDCMYPIYPNRLNYQEKDWIHRSNKRFVKHYEQNKNR